MTCKNLVILLLVFILSGCGSFRTVVASNEKIASDLKRNKTYCSVSTRVYSGVTYDFCRFHAKPKAGTVNGIKTSVFVIDMILLSPVFDTVLLPITITQQVLYGNPEID